MKFLAGGSQGLRSTCGDDMAQSPSGRKCMTSPAWAILLGKGKASSGLKPEGVGQEGGEAFPVPARRGLGWKVTHPYVALK